MPLNRQRVYSLPRYWNDQIIRNIKEWFRLEDSERRMNFVAHISAEGAYKQILDELFTMDDRFYADFHAQKLRRSLTKIDRKKFAINEMIQMLDVIYQERDYNLIVNDEVADYDSSESNTQSAKLSLRTPETEKIRMLCANIIWRNWCNQTHRSSRVGVILISTMEASAEKVLLISHIKEDRVNYGFPKGKPHPGESIRTGGFREFKEETGVNELKYHLGIDEDNGVVIKKYPHIGPIGQRQSRTHYYIITTASTQFTSFRPATREVLDVEWHSVYTLPCCNECQIARKRKMIIEDAGIPINYHMVTLRDINGQNSAVVEILAYIDAKNGNRNARDKYYSTHRKCKKNLC